LVEWDERYNPVRLVGVTLDITGKMRAEEALREAHEELEHRVKERTAELVEANTKLTNEIAYRQETERELRESRERLHMAIESTELGLWELNIQTGDAVHDPRALAMIGFTSEEAPPTLDFWGSRCHSDDLSRIRKAFNDHVKGITPLYQCEYRILAKSDEWKWVASRGKVIELDENGNPLRMAGTILDITDRKESEEQLKANVREKEVLLREIHHRVKNNLQLMGSMLALQADSKNDSSVADILKDGERRIWSMALVHETLYRTDNFGTCVGSEYFESLLDNFQAGNGGFASNILLERELGDLSLGVDSAINCGLIMNELISNSIKHAFPDGSEGTVKVSLRSLAGEQLELVVSDDGVGVPGGFDLENISSFGLDLVNMLVDELSGQISVDTGMGTRFRITFCESSQTDIGCASAASLRS
jgi:PAS domain S-box-containing protein